jgi:hypothetical protein
MGIIFFAAVATFNVLIIFYMIYCHSEAISSMSRRIEQLESEEDEGCEE